MGSSNTDTGKASGNLETKYKFKDYGLTFAQKWNTDNTLGTELTMEDKVRGSGVMSWAPRGNELKQEYV